MQHFHRKVSSSTSCVQPRALPPTPAAAKYHSLRVNHQVQRWRGVHKCGTEWGWRFEDDKMSPVATDLQPATEHLLEAINYNCKTDCSSTRCSCVKFGLYCSPACGQCKGLLCCNVQLYNFMREIVILTMSDILLRVYLPLQVRLKLLLLMCSVSLEIEIVFYKIFTV